MSSALSSRAAAPPLPTLGFLGPEGSFTHEAALSVRGVELVAVSTNIEAVDRVESGELDSAMVPVDNSVEGPVTAVLDRLVFATERVRVLSEHRVDITFNAWVSADTPAGVSRTSVLSHPHALAQCASWIRACGLTPVPVESTAAAAVAAAADPSLIAISSLSAGKRLGLKPLAVGVEDHSGAQTRFFRIGCAPLRQPAPTRSLLVLTPASDRTGVLAEILGVLALRSINLSGLTVRPLRDGLGRYCFVLTLDADVSRGHLREPVEEFLAMGVAVKFLGAWAPQDEGSSPGPSAMPLPPGSLRPGHSDALRAGLATELGLDLPSS